MCTKLCRLRQIVQPADAFLLLDRHLVGLIFFFRAAVPLNFCRVQNLTAARPSGSPSRVIAKLECMRMPQTVWDRTRPALSRPLFTLLVMPIAPGFPLVGELRRVVEHKDQTFR